MVSCHRTRFRRNFKYRKNTSRLNQISRQFRMLGQSSPKVRQLNSQALAILAYDLHDLCFNVTPGYEQEPLTIRGSGNNPLLVHKAADH
ncbi:hypothetical protein TRIP_B50391 [uncultured Desulfatiglans sp.]|uniref:Uncharacterized protein n=1 Tax=Uncultured Desulfatiglans sp. TaxID=1748965 RepID=A0A653AIJ7_UNCDX|nr:hypothetical protein TRIP_B50391 [uncultured Desulfatiglans sp.]